MHDYVPDNDARQAMRAYLQRAEVRMSTMHRIAGVFLNGAGLLILFPVFFRDAISDINEMAVNQIDKLYTAFLSHSVNIQWFIDIGLYAALFIPFFITLTIPLYAFYLLLKDIVFFYFAGQSPGYGKKLFNPRFVLSGLAFSTDESPAAKRQVIHQQYTTDLVDFILPFAESEAGYYDAVYAHTEGRIVPETRKSASLEQAGVFAADHPQPSAQAVHRFNTALGLAGFLDRTLIEEVARAEISVVRYAICLRRLVLRYIKALLMFVWTTLLSFILVSFLGQATPLLILAIGYVVWSLLTPRIVGLPTMWLNQGAPHRAGVAPVDQDDQLVKFEHTVGLFCKISLVISLVALVVEVGRFLM
jgi:hypothetical protein